MKHCLLIWMLAVMAAVALSAGDYADDVKALGDKNQRSGAVERLAKAADEAFDDLLEGMKQNPDEEGITADVKAERSARRLECVRLLGALEDTRASADMVLLLQSQAVESPSYPWLGAACASALGRLWSGKPANADRNEVARALKTYAADAKLDSRLRWGSLHGLAALKDGGDIAGEFLAKPKDGAREAEQVLRSAAIEVVVATKHTASADALLSLWDTQRLGPKGEDGKRTGAIAADYSKPLGLQALFALAELGDKRAVDGLVDVCTLGQFNGFVSLRAEAVRQMKQKALESTAISALVATFKDVDKPSERGTAAQTLGEFGAAGVTAFLDIADDEAPKPKEGEPEDKYKADYYATQVDTHLSNLRSDDAMEAFVEAYGKLPAESVSLRGKIIDHLLGNRNVLKGKSVDLFRTAADDTTLEAPKRANAINAWAESKGKESFDDLARWVKDTDDVIRAQASQNLGRSYIPLAKSLPLLKDVLADRDEKYSAARQNALQGLQRSDEKELLPLFVDSLDPTKEPVANVRNAALKAIDIYRRNSRVSDEDVYPAVKARTSDPDQDVRATAISTASVMAERMGNKTDSTSIIEKGLGDDSKEVRLQAYGRVNPDIDGAKVIRAALLEDELSMKGAAVQALANLSEFGEDSDQQKRLADMALSVIEDRSRENAAKTLLGKLPATVFGYISDKARARLEEVTNGDRKEYQKAAVLVRVLIAVQDNTYFKTIEELADVPNVELRRACVEYIKTFGTKNNVAFLRKLLDRTDAAAMAVRADIEGAVDVLSNR
ncbi:MAG: HEAT repeat domain-containing protein [Planctomycetes bacterium]|nr:HEAT repeat domain-containing protein [Planctomycetota bacterium]